GSRGDDSAACGKLTHKRFGKRPGGVAVQAGEIKHVRSAHGECGGILKNEIAAAGRGLAAARGFVHHETVAGGSENNGKGESRGSAVRSYVEGHSPPSVGADRIAAAGYRKDRKSTRLNSSHRTISYA